MRQPPPIIANQLALPAVQRISLGHPARWLKAGLDDMLANPVPSIAYGLLFSIGGDLILLGSLRETYLFMTALSGFFLVAPLLSSGLYELSRLRGLGAKPVFIDSLRDLGRSLPSLTLFGLALAIVAALWTQITAVAFSSFANLEVGLGEFLRLMTSGEHRLLMATWLIVGAALALAVFAFSAVSVPMMLDRGTDFVTAVLTSLRAFSMNLEAMVLWAAIIVTLSLLSFATLMVGLVFVMPILGHATWHAYRDLVK